MTIHEKLKITRERRNLSQEDVAAVCGCSQNKVSLWENAKGRPNLKEGLAAARLLGVPLEYLIDDAMDEPPPPPWTDAEARLIAVCRLQGVPPDHVVGLIYTAARAAADPALFAALDRLLERIAAAMPEVGPLPVVPISARPEPPPVPPAPGAGPSKKKGRRRSPPSGPKPDGPTG